MSDKKGGAHKEKVSLTMTIPADQHTKEDKIALTPADKEKNKDWVKTSLVDLIKGVNNLSKDLDSVETHICVGLTDINNQLIVMKSQIDTITQRLAQVESVVGKINNNLTMTKEEVGELKTVAKEAANPKRPPLNW